MSEKRAVSTQAAPTAIGPYSQGITCRGWYFFSGQIPLDPRSGTMVGKDIVEQTKQVLGNISALLSSQKLTPKDVVKTTVFLKNMGDFQAFNEIYSQFFSSPFPARSTVEVARLPKDALIEIEVIAAQHEG
ncbi:MAG: RidA family protein [Deltaproteobacteria bacterium]|nr:RidA family protein [Deltaproteobacteria bacterium]